MRGTGLVLVDIVEHLTAGHRTGQISYFRIGIVDILVIGLIDGEEPASRIKRLGRRVLDFEPIGTTRAGFRDENRSDFAVAGEGEFDAVGEVHSRQIDRFGADVLQFDELELIVIRETRGQFFRGRSGRVVVQLGNLQRLEKQLGLHRARHRDRLGVDQIPLEVIGLEGECVLVRCQGHVDPPTVSGDPGDLQRPIIAGESDLADVDPAASLDGRGRRIHREVAAGIGRNLERHFGREVADGVSHEGSPLLDEQLIACEVLSRQQTAIMLRPVRHVRAVVRSVDDVVQVAVVESLIGHCLTGCCADQFAKVRVPLDRRLGVVEAVEIVGKEEDALILRADVELGIVLGPLGVVVTRSAKRCQRKRPKPLVDVDILGDLPMERRPTRAEHLGEFDQPAVVVGVSIVLDQEVPAIGLFLVAQIANRRADD